VPAFMERQQPRADGVPAYPLALRAMG